MKLPFVFQWVNFIIRMFSITLAATVFVYFLLAARSQISQHIKSGSAACHKGFSVSEATTTAAFDSGRICLIIRNSLSPPLSSLWGPVHGFSPRFSSFLWFPSRSNPKSFGQFIKLVSARGFFRSRKIPSDDCWDCDWSSWTVRKRRCLVESWGLTGGVL